MDFFWYILAALFGVILSMRFVVGGLLKFVHPTGWQVKKDYSLQPTVSVLLPCFNEGQIVYETIRSIMANDYPMDKLEILCLDDCSVDDSYEWMLKAQSEYPDRRIRVFRNEENMGKSRTLLRGLALSDSEMILSIDSDTLFAPNCVKELMACFGDPKMGAVGGVVGLRNANENFLTAFQAFQYYLGFRLYKITENWTKTVGCIAGPLFAVRRSVFEEVAPLIAGRNWCGVHITDGEDRFLTHMIVLKGYNTYINLDAQCWTIAPTEFKQYFVQQLRWRRSPIRDFFLTIRTLPQHLDKPFNVLYIYLILPASTLATLFRIYIALLKDPMFLVNPTVVSSYMLLASIVYLAIKKWNPEQDFGNPFKLAVFGTWWLISTLFLTTLSLFTLDSGDWGTRAKVAEPAHQPVIELTPPVEQSAAAVAGD
jgi:hyaluronan synthase